MNLLVSNFKIYSKNQGFIMYLKNTSWLFGEKILRMTIGIFVAIWIARYLGPNQFGLLSYAISFVGLFTAISTLGLDNIIVRELVKNNFNRDSLLGTAFYLRLFGATLVLFFLVIALQISSINYETKYLIYIIASSTIFQSFNVIDFYFQSKIISKYIVYANVITFFISSILKVIFILNEASLITFAYLMLFDSFLVACGYLYYYHSKQLSINKWAFDMNIAIALIKDSWPLIFSGIIVSLYMKIDQVMIKEMLDNKAVGQYAAAVKLSEAWYFIPAVIATSLFPAILNAKKQSIELYYSRLQNLYDLMFWIAFMIALPMTFLSDWIINLLYGKEYYQAGAVLMIHIWTGLFVFLGVASSNWFLTENLQTFSLYRTIAGAIINISLNFILIPLYSIYGAAVASLIAQFIASYAFNAFNKKTIITFKLQTNSILLPLRLFGIKYE